MNPRNPKARLQQGLKRPRRWDRIKDARARVAEGEDRVSALREAEERWNFALECAGDGVWDWDAQTNRVFYSRQWKWMLGYAEDEIGDTLAEWQTRVHPDDLAGALKKVKAHLAGETPNYVCEQRMRCKDGSYKWILDSGKVVAWTEDHQPLRVIGTHKDISERKAAEEKYHESEKRLRKSQEMLRETASIGNVGGWEFNLDTLKQTWTEQVYRIHDVGPGANLDEVRWYDFYTPEVRALVEKAVQDAVESGTSFDLELPFTTAKGDHRWIHAIGAADLDQRRVRGFFQDITGWKQSEAQFRSLFESMTEVSAIHEIVYAPNGEAVDYRILDCNPAFERVIGIPRQQAVGALASQLYGTGEAPYFDIYLGVAETGSPITFETDFSPLEKIFNISVFSPQKGRFVTVASDITERKNAEIALHGSEEQYRLLFEAANDGVALHPLSKDSSRNHFLRFNQNICRMLGYTAAEMAQFGPIDIQPPEEQAQVPAEVEQMQENRELRFEKILRRKDGTLFPVEIHSSVFELNGELTVLSIIRDITERKRNELALRESERRLSMLLSNLIGFAYRCQNDRDWTVEYISGGCQAITGYLPEDLVGNRTISYNELIHPDDREAVWTIIQEALRKQLPYQLEYRITTRKQEEKWVWEQGQGTFVNGVLLALEGYITDITERKQAEHKLKETEERLELVLEGSQLGYWDWDIVTGTVHRNQRWAEILGYTLEEIKFSVRQWTDLHHPDDRERAWQSIRDHLEGKTPAHRIEYRMLAKDGQYKWILDQARVVKRDAQGRPLRMSGTHTDITERKQAEEALLESEERFSTAFFTNPVAQSIITQEGNDVLAVNDACCALFEYRREELIGASTARLNLWEDPALRQAAVAELRSTGRLSPQEATVRMKSGHNRTVIAAIEPISWKGIPCLITSTLDITERKQAEDGLRASEERYRRLVAELDERVQQRTAEVQDLYDNAPAGYHSLDAEGRFVNINQTELNWLGYSSEELIGRHIFFVLTLASQEAFRRNFARFKQKGVLADLEMEFVRKDGSTFATMVNAAAIYDAQGNYLSSRSTVFDNTENKKAENALRHANVELARAIHMKDDFLANMSHELRTPLNGILGLAEALELETYGRLSERQLRAILNIETSGRHLLSLINDILDLSKIEAGKLEIHIEPVVVVDICQASLAFIKEPANKKAISVEFSPDPRVTTLLADVRRMKQILVNLLGNAVKFTPAGGRITLKVQANIAQRAVEFSVTDTGIGIAPADLAHLFNPFTQVDSSLTRQYEGSGLGLALVKELVELHSGSVRVESEVGRGSTFTVAIPWQSEAALQEPLAPTALDAAGTAVIQPPRKSLGTILLAEDAEINIMTIGDFLASQGYEMLFALNGQEAIETAQAHLPDLILMDVQMPVIDGLEVTRRLRADPRFASVPIIALTAMAMTGDRERCLAAGATEYLSKPVKLRELVERIRALIGGAPTL